MKKKIFFDGLNELRAIAAIVVIFHHIELNKFREKIHGLYDTKLSFFIEHIGKNGVFLFFVLSGFLITYLLLREKENHSKINLKNFYLRRVFRIWPLYYIIMFLGFVVIPFLANHFDVFHYNSNYFSQIMKSENYSSTSLLTYLTFIPNIALHLKMVVVGCSQTWSVGVEEQFYLFWPLIIMIFSRKNILLTFLGLLFLLIGFSLKVLTIFPFEFMAIGAIGGYLLFYYEDKVRSVLSKIPFLYFLLICIILVLMSVQLINMYFQSLALAGLFILLIITTVTKQSEYTLKNKWLSFVMFLVFPFIIKYVENGSLLFNVLAYVLTLGITFLVSHLSYHYLELKFIEYKDKKFNTL